MVNNTQPSNTVLKIYKNRITPESTDTVSNFVESTDPSYSAITLGANMWTFTTQASLSMAIFPKVFFTFVTTDLVYGCYVTNSTGDKLLWVEKFPEGPYRFQGIGILEMNPQLIID